MVEIEYRSGDKRNLQTLPTWNRLLADLEEARRVVIDQGGLWGYEVYHFAGEGWSGIVDGIVGTTFSTTRHVANTVRVALGGYVVLVTKMERKRTHTLRIWLYEGEALLGSITLRESHVKTVIDIQTTHRGRSHAAPLAEIAAQVVDFRDKSRDEIQDLVYAWLGA